MSLVSSGSRWQQQRRELNHSRLQNGLISSLSGFLTRLRLPAPDEERLREFLRLDLAKWPALGAGISALVDEMPRALSPLAVLESETLAELQQDRRARLALVVGLAWSGRHGIPALTGRVLELIRQVDEAHAALLSAIPDVARVTLDGLRAEDAMFESFRAACLDLSSAVTALPRAVFLP